MWLAMGELSALQKHKTCELQKQLLRIAIMSPPVVDAV
jgi:hypothetical protein